MQFCILECCCTLTLVAGGKELVRQLLGEEPRLCRGLDGLIPVLRGHSPHRPSAHLRRNEAAEVLPTQDMQRANEIIWALAVDALVKVSGADHRNTSLDLVSDAFPTSEGRAGDRHVGRVLFASPGSE